MLRKLLPVHVITECFECCDWLLTMLTATLELCVLPCNWNTIDSQIQIQIYSVNGASHSFVLYKLKPCSELARSTDVTAPGSVFGRIFCPPGPSRVAHVSRRVRHAFCATHVLRRFSLAHPSTSAAPMSRMSRSCRAVDAKVLQEAPVNVKQTNRARTHTHTQPPASSR